MNNSPAISLDNVSFSYGGPLVLDAVSLDVEQQEFLGIVGPNGGGKSTLLRIILGLLTPLSGEVSVLGLPPERGRADIGYVPQYETFSRDFPVSVEDTVLLGRLGRSRGLLGYTRADREAASEAMNWTAVYELRSRRLGSLSGGQFQRVLIARALVSDPRILILDEPTAHIDLRVEEDIFELLRELTSRLTIVVVSHDVGFISRYVSRVACLNRSLMCRQSGSIGKDIIEKVYGVPVRAIPHNHHEGSGETTDGKFS